MKHSAYCCLVAVLGCVAPDAIPQLGDRHQIQKAGFSMMVASAQTWPYEEVHASGCKFGVGVNQDGRIAYVDTNDIKFKTPEGISVGSTLEEVLKTGAKQPWAEPGWAFHTELPSGWSVAFVTGRGMTNEPLQTTSKVAWLFKRK